MAYYDPTERILDEMHDEGWFNDDPEDVQETNTINWSRACCGFNGQINACLKIMELCNNLKDTGGYEAARSHLERVESAWDYAYERLKMASHKYR